MLAAMLVCGANCNASVAPDDVDSVEADSVATPIYSGQLAVVTTPYTTDAMPRRVTNPDELSRYFTAEEIPDSIFARMYGKSFSRKCTVPRSELRYLRLLHNDANGQTRTGEMIVNQAIADKVLRVMRRLYEAGYRIERIELIDNYGASDTRSIDHNNTSAFNFRTVAGTNRLSRHARGLAIDLNPLYNPYIVYKRVKGRIVPSTHRRKWAFDRDTRNDIPYKIDSEDLAVKLFLQEGFNWGGDWTSEKDYQHFDYKIPE